MGSAVFWCQTAVWSTDKRVWCGKRSEPEKPVEHVSKEAATLSLTWRQTKGVAWSSNCPSFLSVMLAFWKIQCWCNWRGSFEEKLEKSGKWWEKDNARIARTMLKIFFFFLSFLRTTCEAFLPCWDRSCTKILAGKGCKWGFWESCWWLTGGEDFCFVFLCSFDSLRRVFQCWQHLRCQSVQV